MTLATLFSILLVLFSFYINTTTQTQTHCLPDQRDALIQLKKGFDTTELHSWNASTDCCMWDGIACDEQTGMVTALNLTERGISGKLHPALFNLSSLRYLNLAINNFNHSIIRQTGFEQLANLTYLDLYDSGFAGKVPIGFSALTNLIALNLSYNTFYLHDKGLETLLSNLSNLQALRLDGVDISLNGSEWGKAVFQVRTTLQELSMAHCGLRGNLPDELFQLTNLTELDLSLNPMLPGQLPYSIGNLQYLSKLDLYNCSFYGELPPSITNLTKLEVLSLGLNRLTGTIPSSLFSHPSLLSLGLSGNQFSGYLPEFLNGSSILEHIELGYNNLQGQVPISIFKSPLLEWLTLGSNNFSGTLNIDVLKHNKNLYYLDLSNNTLLITEGRNNESFYASFPQLSYLGMASCNLTKFPSFLTYQRNIEWLDLSNNRMDGVIPDLLNSKGSISLLNLSHNFFTKIEGDKHFTSFSMLQILYIHNNRISGPVPLLPPNILEVDFSSNYFHSLPVYFHFSSKYSLHLSISNNNLAGLIPLSICNKSSLQFLDLSYNNFTGTMPSCLLENSQLTSLNLRSNKLTGPLSIYNKSSLQFRFLDLSYNNFTGTMPSCLLENSELKILNLRSNKLTGPLSICNESSLQFLDLSYNNFTGTMPSCLLENSELKILNLRSNKLAGQLPRNICQQCKLRTIDLSGNRIMGSLPQSLMNCKDLEVLDLGNNQIVDKFPFWLGNLNKLRVLVLRSNQLYGTISAMEAKTKIDNSFFPTLTVFDLSSNNFRGNIPKIVFESMKTMVTNLDSSTFKFQLSALYYYHDSITVISKGQEMEIKSSLSIFSSLDLSQNGFSGEIPEEIGQLKSLDVLNLSHNVLTGPIPSEFANLHQLQSLDLSFNQLSGNIPQELTLLTFLSVLNLSYNNLVGEIPEARQFSTFLNASYLGNPGLCGSPLSMQCATTPSNDGLNKYLPSKSSTDIIGLSISIGLGLGVGFAYVIWAIVSWENGREHFNFIVDGFYFRHIPWIVRHLCWAIRSE